MLEQITKAATQAGLFTDEIRKGFTNDYLKGLERMVKLLQGKPVATIIQHPQIAAKEIEYRHTDLDQYPAGTQLYVGLPDTLARLELYREQFPCLTGNDGKSYAELSELYLSQKQELEAATQTLEHLEAMRPHWAKGYSDESVAAQVATFSLIEIWKLLGVANQTEAIQKIQELINEH